VYQSEPATPVKEADTEQDLKLYLRHSLADLGLREVEAEVEVGKILVCLRKVVDRLDGGSVGVCNLTTLLTAAGFSSGHVAARLAAKLCLSFIRKESGPEEKTIAQESKRSPVEKFPARVMRVEEGYPRMALGIAYHLHNCAGYTEAVSKSLAKSMVEVWIKYEVSYRKLQRIAASRKSDQVKDVLRNLLETKVNGCQENKKARRFQFFSLIDMTLKFFDIANNNRQPTKYKHCDE